MNTNDIYKAFQNSSGVCTDTRKLDQNCIFFALKGKNFNGNKYAEKAISQGAKYAVIDELKYKIDDRYILVKDVLTSLQEIAKIHRDNICCPVIGITGTNGKTTTKELINAVLSSKYKTNFTKGNLNNEIGVPLTILSTSTDTEILIVEMGANHINEIGFLCQIAKINYGLITNIGKAHLEGFENYENIIKTKNELYEYIRSTSNTVFVNQKDPLLLDLSSQINRVLYNQYTEVTENEFVTLNIENQKVQTQLIGSYNIPNIIAAYTIGKFFKVEKNCIADAISKYKPTNNRSELKKTNLNNTLILDAYNANPSSMSLAINSFIKTKSENSILILGDMLELGKNSLSEHQKIIDLLNETQNLKIILVGREFKSCKHSFLQFLNTQELKSWILKNKIENSKILLKGSRGIKLEELEPSL